MLGIINGINNIFGLYLFLIILRIFFTWIPNINWYNQPWQTLANVVDLYLNLFKKLRLQINGLDFSPIIAIIVLQIVQQLTIFVLAKFI